MLDQREKLIDIINDFFGCDAAYFDVNPFDLATHMIAKGVMVKTTKVKPVKKPQKEISQETLNALTTMGRKAHGEV